MTPTNSNPLPSPGNAETEVARKPLSAEYIHTVHTEAMRAMGDVVARRNWGNGKTGSPATTLALCGEVARLNIERADILAALKLAVGHIEHMAAFIGGKNNLLGYSFESLGEDMPGIRAAITKATGAAS